MVIWAFCLASFSSTSQSRGCVRLRKTCCMRLRKTCCNELGTAYLPIPAAYLCACCCRDDVSHSGEKIDWGQWAITGNDPEFGGTGNPDTGDDYGPAPGALTTSQLLRVILGVLYPDICPCSQPPAVIIFCLFRFLSMLRKAAMSLALSRDGRMTWSFGRTSSMYTDKAKIVLVGLWMLTLVLCCVMVRSGPPE